MRRACPRGEKGTVMWTYFERGGPIMWPLLALSILGITVVFWRWWDLRQATTGVTAFLKELRGKTVHKVETIEAYAFEPGFLDGIAEATERYAAWALVRQEGALYVTIGKRTFEGRLEPVALGGE